MSGGFKLIRSSVIMIAIYALANQLAFGQTCPTPELLKKPTKLSKLFPKDPGQKREFETTAEYEIRANPRGPTGPLALEISSHPSFSSISYDADASRFRYQAYSSYLTGVLGENNFSAAMCGKVGSECRGIISLTTEDNSKSLLGNERMFKGDMYLVFDGDALGTVADLDLTDIPPKEASLLKPRLKVVVLVEPKEKPFYRTSFDARYSTYPTLERAGTFGNYLGLNAEIKCVGILDSKSGSVLASREVVYAKPNAKAP